MQRWYHKMMDPFRYLHLQLRLEGKEVLQEQFLREMESIPGEELPLMLIAQLANGTQAVYYDEAISPDLRERLAALIAAIEFPDIEPLLEALKAQNLLFEVGHYKTYVFPSVPVRDADVHRLSKDEERVKAFGFGGFTEQVYVIEREGKMLSACVSARESDACGEAWVFTSPEYRHQGFAQAVVRAWAASLIDAGKVPFYSHRIDNEASANVAKTLNLQPVFEEIVLISLK
jgi:GNAT superfamily N-acetyltransferase